MNNGYSYFHFLTSHVILYSQEFSYSFSVFVSEIPLANMVFGFAKSLMKNSEEDKADMRFKDSDVWSILNYLGKDLYPLI